MTNFSFTTINKKPNKYYYEFYTFALTKIKYRKQTKKNLMRFFFLLKMDNCKKLHTYSIFVLKKP